MGLDMYLHAKKYVSAYEWRQDPEGDKAYLALLDLCSLNEVADPRSPMATVSVTACYWRKANAVHQWFVENVQNGEDECREHYVEKEQLATLIKACQEAIDLHKSGGDPASILPPTSGFFFGSTDVDEYYIADLQHTVDKLTPLLAVEDTDFYYQSSW